MPYNWNAVARDWVNAVEEADVVAWLPRRLGKAKVTHDMRKSFDDALAALTRGTGASRPGRAKGPQVKPPAGPKRVAVAQQPSANRSVAAPHQPEEPLWVASSDHLSDRVVPENWDEPENVVGKDFGPVSGLSQDQIYSASGLARACGLPGASERVVDSFTRAVKGSILSVQVPRAGHGLVPWKITSRETGKVPSHPTLGSARHFVQSALKLDALQLANHWEANLLEPGGKVSRCIDVPGAHVSYTHICAPMVPEIPGDVERRRQDRYASGKGHISFCRDRVQACPVAAKAATDERPLVVLLLDVYYYPDVQAWVETLMKQRSECGFNTAVYIQVHDYSALPEGEYLRPQIDGFDGYPSEGRAVIYRENGIKMVRQYTIGNEWPYQHPVVSLSRRKLGVGGRRTSLIAQVGLCKGVRILSDPANKGVGAATNNHDTTTASRVSVARQSPRRAVALSVVPSEASAASSPPLSEVSAASATRASRSASVVSLKLPKTHDLIISGYRLLQEYTPDTVVYAGPGGVFVGAHARMSAGGDQSVAIPAALAERAVFAHMLSVQKGTPSKLITAVVEREVEKAVQEPLERVAIRQTIPTWLAHYSYHFQAYGRLNAATEHKSSERVRLRTDLALTSPWNPLKSVSLRAKQVWNEIAVHEPRPVIPTTFPPKMVFGVCQAAFWDGKLPSNVVAAATYREARKKIAEAADGPNQLVQVDCVLVGNPPSSFPICDGKTASLRSIGPCFETRPSIHALCPANTFLGFMRRGVGLLGTQTSGVSAKIISDTFAFAVGSLIGGRQGISYEDTPDRFDTPQEWSLKTNSKMVDQLLEASREVEITDYHVNTDINLFPKREASDVVLVGTTQPYKGGAIRVISDRNKHAKAFGLGITSVLGWLLHCLTLFVGCITAVYAVYARPEDLSVDIANYINSGVADVHYIEVDISKMDGSTVPTTRQCQANAYSFLGGMVVRESTHPEDYARLILFIRWCRERLISFIRYTWTQTVLLRSFGFNFSAFVRGTVASGDMDTTLGNTLTSIVMIIGALTECGIILSEILVRVAGDDMLMLLPGARVVEVVEALTKVYSAFGYVIKIKSGPFMDGFDRPEFCSRIYFVYPDDKDTWKVIHARKISRALVRFGWTTVADIGLRQSLGLLRGKALCELTWASEIPVLGAFFSAVARRPDVLTADMILPKDETLRLLEWGRSSTTHPALHANALQGNEREQRRLKQLAVQLAGRVNIARREPPSGLREAFAVYTGIPPDQQVMLEDYLTDCVNAGNVEIPDAALLGLIRPEWL